MLKAAVVYLQGSGGNLLARTLALSEQTVAYLPYKQHSEQPTATINALDRLKLYNNWNSKTWCNSEKEIRIWYHYGVSDFYKYEETNLWLIDQFHPAMFESELSKQILFDSVQSWENLIFIHWKKSSLDLIIKLSSLKRKDLNHRAQIESTELDIFEKLIKTHPAHIVNWEDMLEEITYIQVITDLAQKLNLVLNFSLVRQLWRSWKTETDKILNT